MATLSAQIQDLVGSFTDETAMDQWLEDGAKEIINVLPESLQKLCTSMQTFTSVAAGSEAETLNTGKIFSVFAGSVDCREINNILKYRAEDSGRIDYATSTDPVYYVESNFINVLPTSLSCKYEEVQYPASIDADSDSAISSFPDEAEYLVVLYASIKALQQQMNTKQGDLPTDVVVPVLETITESLPTWSAPSDFVVPVKPAVPTISSQVVADPSSFAPTYTKPVLSLKVTPTISDLSITVVPPDTPSLNSITFSSINSAVDASLTTVDTITIGSVLGSSTLPDYSKLGSTTLSGVTAFNSYWELADFGDSDPGLLSITAISPAIPTISSQVISDPSNFAPTYTKPVISLKIAPTISDLSITAVPPDVPTLSSIAFASIDGAVDASLVPVVTSVTLGGVATAPSYTTPSQASDSFTDINTALDNEDIELASARINEAQLIIQDELNEFNEEQIKFQASIQEAMAEFQSSNQMAIGNAERSQNRQLQNSAQDMKVIYDNNAQSIQKFSTEVQEYQAEVNMQVQEYQQNLQGDLQVWQTERQTDLQKYGSDMQNELNEFNKENAKYQAILQEYIQEAQLLDTHEARKLQKYQAEVSTYSADVNKQVQEYGQKLSRYTTELNTVYQAWAKTESDRISAIQADISDELNEFNKDNVLYQARVQETMAEFQQKNQMNISNAERSQNRQLQNSINDAKLIYDNNAQKIQKYQAEASLYQMEVTTEVQEYQQNLAGDIQVWQAERSTDLQKYSSDVQNELNEFNKENAKYQAIIQEYIQEAQLLDAHEARKLQKYQAEVGTYSAEINTNVQIFTQALTKNRAAFDTSLQKYTSEVQKVTSVNQSKIQVYTGEVSNFTQIIQKQSVDYQWLQGQYAQLKADYQQGLQLLRGGGTPQPQQAAQQQ